MIEIITSTDKGSAILIASLIAAFSSVFCLFISLSFSRNQEKLKNRLEEKSTINKESREFKLRQLTEFYDPIYTLLCANKDIFNRIGPISDARRSGQFNDEETSEVWEKLSNEVVVPNNLKISEIIQEKLHLLSDSDDESPYLDFVTHAHAYKVFKQNTYEAYQLFPYPSAAYETIVKERNFLKGSIYSTYSLKKGRFKKWLCLMLS